MKPAQADERGKQNHGQSHYARPFGWTTPWMVRCTVLSGVCALVWLLLRSGTKPARIAYPCQQAAFGTAALVFGVPVVAALLHVRERIVAFMRTATGRLSAGGLAALLGVVTLASVSSRLQTQWADPPADYRPQVFLVNEARGVEPGTYGGVDDLVSLMGLRGLKLHRSATHSLTSGPDGLVDPDDVLLLKVNSQWPERGGTNTDVLRGVIRNIVEHPDGFTGEIVVADNGQGVGSLAWTSSNAEDITQSAQDVVDDFAGEGWNISTKRWDPMRSTGVGEYSQGNMTDGYVVTSTLDPETQIKVSYPKFQTALGTYISYKYGVWSPQSVEYDSDKLVVINVPVLKTHSIYGITAAVKNHMGVITTGIATDSHVGVGRGGLGSVLAEVRPPDLNILDCIWVLAKPGYGPSARYVDASRRDQLVASTDPAALDVWAARNILIPQIIANGYTYEQYRVKQDPDDPASVFRTYLDRSVNEMLLGGIDTNCAAEVVDLHVWRGDGDRDGDVDLFDYSAFESCVTGPGGSMPTGCDAWDFDADEDIDARDFAALQMSFTGVLPRRSQL